MNEHSEGNAREELGAVAFSKLGKTNQPHHHFPGCAIAPHKSALTFGANSAPIRLFGVVARRLLPSAVEGVAVNRIIYIVGAIVVVIALLSFFGLR